MNTGVRTRVAAAAAAAAAAGAVSRELRGGVHGRADVFIGQ